MPNITMHLTANFYPPIPADIQIACQTFFDQIVEDAMPWQIMDKDGNIIDQDIADYDVLDRTLILPNGAEITARGMLDELRLSESKEYAGQLSFWENE